jgi:hypothetical protein
MITHSLKHLLASDASNKITDVWTEEEVTEEGRKYIICTFSLITTGRGTWQVYKTIQMSKGFRWINLWDRDNLEDSKVVGGY